MKHAFGAERRKRVGSCQYNFDARRLAPRFQAFEEYRDVGAEHVAAAFDHDGVGLNREARRQRRIEELIDAVALRRIGGRQPEIDAVENLRGAKILISHDLGERRGAGRFQDNNDCVPLMSQCAQHGDAGCGLADLG